MLPIFALILTGWLARRAGVLGAPATTELNRFVVWLALPALLFDIVANAERAALWRPDFIAVFGLGAGLLFGATTALRLRRGVPLADAAVDGLNASYANTGYVGFPLALAALGPQALGPTLIAAILTVCALFGMALILIEIGLQTKAGLGRTLLKVGGSLIRNPLLVAPTLGAALMLTGLEVPAPAQAFLKLLGAAASPCALVALGLFLAEKRPAPTGGPALTTGLIGAKLILHPLLTWILATQVFGLSTELTQAAVLLAALPTGTGPFMVAEFYRREAGAASLAVLGSTILSVFTISLYLNLAL